MDCTSDGALSIPSKTTQNPFIAACEITNIKVLKLRIEKSISAELFKKQTNKQKQNQFSESEANLGKRTRLPSKFTRPLHTDITPNQCFAINLVIHVNG